MKGKIYVGYPCIGKTSISGENGCIDLDSSTMFMNPDGVGLKFVRPDGWEEIYVNVALSLARQGYKVFLSSHSLVTKYLKSIGADFIVICPSISLADEWKKRAKERFKNDDSSKNLRALARIIDYYEEDIQSLLDLPVDKIIIDDIDYDLRDKIKEA